MNQTPLALICVADSPHAMAVARQGVCMSLRLGLVPHFVHVSDADEAKRQALLRQLAEAESDVEPRTAQDADAGTPAEPLTQRFHVVSGEPAGAIVAEAVRLRATLVIMGALDRDPPMVRMMGSVARRVARQAPCSVLLLPGPNLEQPPGQRIVVHVMMDVDSLEMVRLAVRLGSRQSGGQVHFVRDFDVSEARWLSTGAVGESVSVERYLSLRREAEETLLREFVAPLDLSGVQHKTVALPGHEGLEAIEYANNVDADLLVMRAPLQRLTFLDRVFHHPIEAVLGRLPCGLLLFRPDTSPAVHPQQATPGPDEGPTA
ncbi:MAG: universal stress protein [Phycisphaerae bacterium]